MENIKNRIDTATKQLEIYTRVIPIIKANQNKQVTKRLATIIEKELAPFYTAYNPDKYLSREITISGNGLKYDDAITFSFTKPLQYGSCSTIKTEAESIAEALNLAEARKDYITKEITALELELKHWDSIKADYLLMIEKQATMLQAFREKYATLENIHSEPQMSYTTRQELENLAQFITSLY